MSEFNAQWQGQLAHLGAIKVTGVDTKKYVQGQVTCNVDNLLPNIGPMAPIVILKVKCGIFSLRFIGMTRYIYCAIKMSLLARLAN